MSNHKKIPEIRDSESMPNDDAKDMAWFAFFLGLVTGFAACAILAGIYA